MIITFTKPRICVSARVPSLFVDELRAYDWCKHALLSFDGNVDGSADGVKAKGYTKRVDQGARDGVVRAAIAKGRNHFN